MAVYRDPRSPKKHPIAYEVAKAICENGFPQNAVEPCLYVADMFEIKRLWQKLKDKGIPGIANFSDFSERLLEHVEMSDYEHDCRENLLPQLDQLDPATARQHRVCENVVRELMVGVKILCKKADIRPPSADTLFKMLAKAGKGNGKSTCALSPKNGNLVSRVAKA
jgi:hypothetical protein